MVDKSDTVFKDEVLPIYLVRVRVGKSRVPHMHRPIRRIEGPNAGLYCQHLLILFN